MAGPVHIRPMLILCKILPFKELRVIYVMILMLNLLSNIT
jgi:hypothetical protein